MTQEPAGGQVAGRGVGVPPRPRQRGALHLLWALPLAGAFAYVMLIGAALTGWGIRASAAPEAGSVASLLALALAGGSAMGAAVGFVPWTRHRPARAWAGAAAGAAVAAGIAVTALGG